MTSYPRRPLAAALAASLLGLMPQGVQAQGTSQPLTQSVSGRLVLYTSQLDADAQGTVDAFRARHPGVAVEWVRGGTSALIPRLRAEFAAGSPRADLLLIADSLTMETLKAENRLLRWADAPRGGVPAAHVDADGFYWGTKLITTGIARNARAPMPITAWADLADPRARGLATMPSPSVSGAALIHLYAIVQNPALGWGYLQRVAANGLSVRGGNGAVMQSVAGGEKAFGMIIDYLPIREAAKGAPVQFVFPAEGVSAITEPVAILAGTRNEAAAKAFVAFLLSREGQELAARQGFLPADPAIAPPAGFPDPETIRVMPLDPKRALAEAEDVQRRFAIMMGH
ncbi:ABC transporter substrate-binding protein [Elioraea sp.]|uniref:ABC transporter substrate-binding protein n=1 Tax=Elioraea sp. TaxID=2185103 RepID=UPI0025C0F854|nr:ABC transporter substrate-binding protein [Elioraea sp.]